MWQKLRVVFTIPELRSKILLTLGLLAIYRVGYQIPLPMVDSSPGGSGNQVDNFLERISVFAATDLRQLTIFGLGIMPYISASIVFQLLGSVWPPIERLRKEGQTGMKKINEYTRYLTVILCVLQSIVFLKYAPVVNYQPAFCNPGSNELHFGWFMTAVAIMTGGTVFLMWLGEQIDEYGIGNGISLLIMASILAQMPQAMIDLRQNMSTQLSGSSGQIGPDKLIVLAALFVAVVFGVVFITMGQRRIQTQSAKHVRGRRVYGGTKQFLPLRINQAGVMPIIFASSLLMIPGLLVGFIASWFVDTKNPESIWSGIANLLSMVSNGLTSGQSLLYIVMYIAMIFFFCYFWTSITFNPKEMSENLKDHGTFIPGYRPGKRTADYLEKVMLRITYVGAGFLAAVAIVPILVNIQLAIPFSVASFYGGTSLLIAVSVAFDLIQKIDNHLLMRSYKGLLES